MNDIEKEARDKERTQDPSLIKQAQTHYLGNTKKKKELSSRVDTSCFFFLKADLAATRGAIQHNNQMGGVCVCVELSVNHQRDAWFTDGG